LPLKNVVTLLYLHRRGVKSFFVLPSIGPLTLPPGYTKAVSKIETFASVTSSRTDDEIDAANTTDGCT
jgi:hypothetical protein